MIRHSKSFFISILIHLTLLLIVIFSWQNYAKKPKEVKEIQEKRICVDIRNMVCATEVIIPKRLQPRKKQKTKKTKKKKPKKVIKKVIPVKIVKEIVVQKIEIIEEVEVVKVELEKAVEVSKPKKKAFVRKSQTVEKSVEQIIFKKSAIDEYIEVNRKQIRELISENLYYPRRARKKHITGDVTVKFLLDIDATVSHVEVENSQSDILSRAAIQTIEDLSGMFPKPKEKITLHLPIGFFLK